MTKITFKKGNDFYEQVNQVVSLVPIGRVTTYGAIARYLGSAQSSRVVGYAMNNSHARVPKVPAHRVVNRNGMLTGKHFFGSDNAMQRMLEAEGIAVENDTVMSFTALFWDPSVYLL